MEKYLTAAIIILSAAVAALIIKIILMKKSAREIASNIKRTLETDTNTLISISSSDKDMKALAMQLNEQLRVLRKKGQNYIRGDNELKRAVTNISHDLRTPLTAICGYLDLIENEEMSDNARRYFEIIKNRSQMLTKLICELFNYSVIVSGEKEKNKEPVIVNDVLEECIAAFYSSLNERNITPNIQMPKSKVARTLDRYALSRLFSNLLNNAVKYSAGDLEITLYETGEIIFSNCAPELSEVQVGRLFDRFYTVESAEKSTGLGLAIAKTLTEQMGGKIFAEYKSGRLSIIVSL